MKECPYCHEVIQDEAVKCRFCGEWFVDPVQVRAEIHKSEIKAALPPERKKWYDSVTRLVIALISLGPAAVFLIPFIWKSKGLGKVGKWILTALILVASILMVQLLVWAVGTILEAYKPLLEIGQGY